MQTAAVVLDVIILRHHSYNSKSSAMPLIPPKGGFVTVYSSRSSEINNEVSLAALRRFNEQVAILAARCAEAARALLEKLTNNLARLTESRVTREQDKALQKMTALKQENEQMAKKRLEHRAMARDLKKTNKKIRPPNKNVRR